MNALAQEAEITTTEFDEHELIQQTAIGNEHAYAQLVTHFSPPVFRFLCRMLNNHDDAEDITQDTFFELYKNRAKLRTNVNILPYLFTIARRKAISLLRWRKVRRVLVPIDQACESHVVSSNPIPRDTTHTANVEKTVNRAIGQLPPAKRAVLILRFFEEMTYQEIAKVMNKPEGTVKSIAFRAEKELRQHLKAIEHVWQR